jgi:hypothetical protein
MLSHGPFPSPFPFSSLLSFFMALWCLVVSASRSAGFYYKLCDSQLLPTCRAFRVVAIAAHMTSHMRLILLALLLLPFPFAALRIGRSARSRSKSRSARRTRERENNNSKMRAPGSLRFELACFASATRPSVTIQGRSTRRSLVRPLFFNSARSVLCSLLLFRRSCPTLLFYSSFPSLSSSISFALFTAAFRPASPSRV